MAGFESPTLMQENTVVTTIELVEGGNIIRQGHHLTIGYIAYDEVGEVVDLSGKDLTVSIWGRKGVAFEADAVFEDGVLRFTLDQALPSGDYNVEFTATLSTDESYRKKYPTNANTGRISVKQSADDLGAVGISIFTIDKFEKKQKALQDEYHASVDSKVETLEADFEQAVGAITVDSEVVLARGEASTLRARLDAEKAATTQQLAEKVGGQVKLKPEEFSDEAMALVTGNGTVNVLSIPQDKSVSPEKTNFVKRGKNLINKATFIPDTSLNVANGEPANVAGAQLSPFLPISENFQITQNKSAVIVFYDSSQARISGFAQVTPYAERTLTTPPETAFYRTAVYSATQLPSYQIENGAVSTPFEDYAIKIENFTLPERSLGQFSSKVPFAYILHGRQITVDWTTKKMSGSISVVYYDDTQINPTNTVFELDVRMNSTSWLYLDLSDGTFKTATKGTVAGKILLIMEIYATTNTFYYYTPYRPAIRLINYDGLDIQYIRGAEIQDGSIFERSLSPQIQTKLNAATTGSKNFLTLNDAFVAWQNGEKFPIAFYNDSTTDGVGTTGWTGNKIGLESTNTNAYPQLLETKMRQATGNDILRFYNAGFSGKTADWGLLNFDGVFLGTSAYKDLKMMGIGWGVNDRVIYATPKLFRDGFKADILGIIEKCYTNNIQPFLLTTQITISPGVDSTQTQYPLRDAIHIETVANEVKRELAAELKLELIDTHDFTERFVKHSQYSAQAIIPDKLHFGNVGHEFEAQLYFAKLNPKVNWIKKAGQLDYANQRIVSGVPENKISIPASVTDSFKVFANYAKADTVDIMIYKVYVFNDSDSLKTLKAFKSDAASLTYVKVNGVPTALDTLEKTIATLDIGLHTLEVYSGASATVDFKGFKLE